MLRRARAFTLIELLLVLVILAVVLALVYVGLDGLLPTSRLGSVAREIGATIAYAKREAALRGKTTKVEYDLGKGRVRVLLPAESNESTSSASQAAAEKPSDFEVVLPQTVKIEAVWLSSQEAKTSGVVTVSFHPTGGATAHVVHLKGEGDLVYSVEVHAITGLVNHHDSRRLPAEAKQEE